MKSFFEDENGEIIIYGAGNAGYWTGYYLNKCSIDFLFYLDRNPEKNETLCNGHHIYTINKLRDYSKKFLRMVITPKVYKEILADLLWLDHLWELDILCIIPQYKDLMVDADIYNINRFLGYFRRKLIKGDTPTIICNTCAGGMIYESLGMPLLSPTINVGIKDDDYIKLCMNLQHYMNCEIKLKGWEKRTRTFGSQAAWPVGIVDDIEIMFAHANSEKDALERWDLLRERINWDRIIFVMEEYGYRRPVSKKAFDDFAKLEGKKLFAQGSYYYDYFENKPSYILATEAANRREPAIENFFDLVEWMNKD
jgi:uncharacterized protein (DUF1919 family)